MILRKAYQAGSFYPADDQACRLQIKQCLEHYQPPDAPDMVAAGIVPHAGWVFSGATAAKVFKTIQAETQPDTFIIFGTTHRVRLTIPAMFDSGAWDTPCGEVAVDEEFADAILEAAPDTVAVNASVHDSEHSIEVQVPFIRYLFPDAKILPIMVGFDHQAITLGMRIGQLIANQQRRIVVIGSTDLTHYGHYWGSPESLDIMEKNDRRMIDLIVNLQAEKVLIEAEEYHSACGAGPIAATISAVKALGKTQGELLEYTTSQKARPEISGSTAVGYAGIVF